MRVRFRVSGRVQGVAYRASALEAARQIGALRGWIANRDDGDVEGVVEGETNEVERFLAWCATGPRLARVTGVERREDDGTEAYASFTIRR